MLFQFACVSFNHSSLQLLLLYCSLFYNKIINSSRSVKISLVAFDYAHVELSVTSTFAGVSSASTKHQFICWRLGNEFLISVFLLYVVLISRLVIEDSSRPLMRFQKLPSQTNCYDSDNPVNRQSSYLMMTDRIGLAVDDLAGQALLGGMVFGYTVCHEMKPALFTPIVAFTSFYSKLF